MPTKHIPNDFERRAAAYDAGRNRQANIRVLSIARLEQQIGSDGATWLDRRLISGEASDLVPAGFGHQVREAMDRRPEAIAASIAYAIGQPEDVDVSEIIVRPTASPH